MWSFPSWLFGDAGWIRWYSLSRELTICEFFLWNLQISIGINGLRWTKTWSKSLQMQVEYTHDLHQNTYKDALHSRAPYWLGGYQFSLEDRDTVPGWIFHLKSHILRMWPGLLWNSRVQAEQEPYHSAYGLCLLKETSYEEIAKMESCAFFPFLLNPIFRKQNKTPACQFRISTQTSLSMHSPDLHCFPFPPPTRSQAPTWKAVQGNAPYLSCGILRTPLCVSLLSGTWKAQSTSYGFRFLCSSYVTHFKI